MQTWRRISQIFFLLVFLFLFIMAIYPGKFFVPVDFFLRLDPLIGISTGLAARGFLIRALPALILILLTVALGRFFCGWICPLGTLIDGVDRITKGKYRNSRFAGWKRAKFFILFLILAAAVFSVQLAGWMDPIALLTRTTATFLYPFVTLISDNIEIALMNIGPLEDAVMRIMHPFHSTVRLDITAFQGGIAIALIFLLILGLGLVLRRFWCRNLCPLGALLGLSSRFRWYKRRVSEDCTECGICRARCRMDAIGEDFLATDHMECISCMDCQAVCPVNAIEFKFKGRSGSAPVDLSRRQVLAAGVAGIATVGVLGTSFTHPKNNARVIRPPGSREEPEFLDRCIRCGECIRVCASKGGHGLHHAWLESGWSGLWTPVLLPRSGYCEYNCNLCGQVCPTGAIMHLPLDEKKEMKLGTAHFDKTRCIPWYYGENCTVCEEVCPHPDKAIKIIEKDTETIDGIPVRVKLPYVDESLCVGCGKCATECPVEGEKGIFVTNRDEQRWFSD
jgi:MauM/NapG family ferredoxin protein